MFKEKKGVFLKPYRFSLVMSVTMALCIMSASFTLAITVLDNDIMIDIDNRNASFTGTWYTVPTLILSSAYGDNYRYALCSGSTSINREAVFDSQAIGIPINETRDFAVYVRWANTTRNAGLANYRIYDGASSISPVGQCSLNQNTNSGQWVYCDTVALSQGSTAVVKLGNDCEYNKYVTADAVRFLKLMPGPQGDKGDPGHSPVLSWSGDQIAIDGSVSGPHLTGPKGDPGSPGLIDRYAVKRFSCNNCFAYWCPAEAPSLLTYAFHCPFIQIVGGWVRECTIGRVEIADYGVLSLTCQCTEYTLGLRTAYIQDVYAESITVLCY